MNSNLPFKVSTAVLAIAFAAQVSDATAQVRITYGNAGRTNSGYRIQGVPVYTSPQYSGYSYTQSPGIRYQQPSQSFRVQNGQYPSGYRGNYAAPYQSYRPNYTTPYQPYNSNQGQVYYGNQVNGNGYYYNGYNSTPSQQRGAAIGGSIGTAIGGQRSGNIGAAIGAAVGGQ